MLVNAPLPLGVRAQFQACDLWNDRERADHPGPRSSSQVRLPEALVNSQSQCESCPGKRSRSSDHADNVLHESPQVLGEEECRSSRDLIPSASEAVGSNPSASTVHR